MIPLVENPICLFVSGRALWARCEVARVGPLSQSRNLILVLGIWDLRCKRANTREIDDKIRVRLREAEHPTFVVGQGSPLCCRLSRDPFNEEALGLTLRYEHAQLRNGPPPNTSATVFMILEGMLLVIGLVMTFKAYGPGRE